MDQTSRRLAALFALGLLALFPPVVGLFNRAVTLFGFPLLPLYLLAVWTLLVILGWALCRGDDRP